MKQTSLRQLAFGLLALAGPLGLATLEGCGERCGPGYHLDRHLCYLDPEPADSAGMAGTPGSAGEADAAACEPLTFASDCLVSDDCTCDADFCAAAPGQTGFCTRTGCDEDPSVCPDGYSCMDLSGFGAGLPHICVLGS